MGHSHRLTVCKDPTDNRVGSLETRLMAAADNVTTRRAKHLKFSTPINQLKSRLDSSWITQIAQQVNVKRRQIASPYDQRKHVKWSGNKPNISFTRIYFYDETTALTTQLYSQQCQKRPDDLFRILATGASKLSKDIFSYKILKIRSFAA